MRETRQTTLTKDFKVSLNKKNSASGKTEQDESAEKIKTFDGAIAHLVERLICIQ